MDRLYCSIEVKRSENNFIVYFLSIRTMEVLSDFVLRWIFDGNLRKCVTQTGGAMDSRAACSLWTAMQWPSRCITERGREREWEKEKRRPPIKTDQRTFSLSLWRTLTFSSPLLYNVGRFCVDPENKQYSGGEDDLFALTHSFHDHRCYSYVHRPANERERKKERIVEKICSSHVHSSLSLCSIYIHFSTIKRIYVIYKKWTIERMNIKPWKMTTTNKASLTCSFNTTHYQWSCWKEEKLIYTFDKVGKRLCKQ